tara:strand:+ start:534 stop:869 length:336 start_codon:yes stop_codon:yes gene_type:complete
MSNYQPEQYAEGSDLMNDPKLLAMLEERKAQHKLATESYKLATESYVGNRVLDHIKKEAPYRLMTRLRGIAYAIDAGDIDDIKEIIFGLNMDGEQNLMDLLGDMCIVCTTP